MKKQFTREIIWYNLWIIVAAFIFIAVMPVSAISAENGTVITQGGTVFIGEQGLNVTHALNQAYYGSTHSGAGPGGIGTPVQNNSNPNLTRIGWWASAADLYWTSPSKTIDLGGNRRYAEMTIAPADFVGYTGNWYLLDASGIHPVGTNGDASMVFIVADPSLDIKIWDYNQNADVTGRSVPQGEKLGFRIDTNMYPALDSRYRTNIIDDSVVGKWAPDLLYVNPRTNVMIDTTGTWVNGTVTIPDPRNPCCSTITFYNRAYTNATNYGAWMTWSNGQSGCKQQTNGPMYYNMSTGRFVKNNSLGIGPNGRDLTPVTWAKITHTTKDWCNQRGPAAATDGYIDLKIKDESNAQITKLYNWSAADTGHIPGPYTVMKNFVDRQPFFWGHFLNSNGVQKGNVWFTGALDEFSQYAYPVGTYTVSAQSTLNRMKDNYKQGGADYTGKTVSQAYTITLVTDTVRIEANKDSVVRSKPFSVTVSGRPGTEYYLWVEGTRNMTGTNGNQPPMIVLNQEQVYMDPYNPTDLTYPIGQYKYENGAGRRIRNDVAISRWTWNGTRCYARIKTSTSGTRTIEFLTTNWTKARKYTIRVEQQFPVGSAYNTGTYKSDEVNVLVAKGAVVISAPGDHKYDPGEEIRFSGYNTESYKTYLFITGPGLKPNGSQIQSADPRQAEVVNGNPATFLQTDVYGDNTWSARWNTDGVYLAPGNYTVWAVSQPYDKPNTLRSGIAYGKVFVAINSRAPAANFTATPRYGTAPLTVWFTDTSTKSPISWNWTYGDGSLVNATEQNPVHTYANAGTYNVSLKSTNAYGNTTVTKKGYITVIPPPPTVTAISPASGKWATTVEISDLIGTGFAPGAMVYLTKTGYSPLNATNVSVLSPTNITCTFGIPVYTATGPWNVRVNNTDGKSGTMDRAFVVETDVPPTVTDITPAVGAQGTTVQISYLAGTGFALDPEPAVQLVKDTETINASNISVVNPDRMTCTFEIPAGAAIGTWTVEVTNADGQYGTKTDAFLVRALPTVTAILPDNGIRGTTVQITNVSGTNFYPGAQVYLTKPGSAPLIATNITLVSPENITCTVDIPAGASLGLWNVTVRNTDGSGTMADAFMVKTPAPPTVTGITPASGIRGTTVQISNLSGTDFALDPIPTVQLVKGADTVTATNITVVDPDTITCTFTLSPYAVAGAWDVSVTNADLQNGVKTGAFTVES